MLKEIEDSNMSLFYISTDKEILFERHKLFQEVGVPALLKNGFEFDPFKTSWHGQYDKGIQGYIYQFARLSENKYLERLEVYIIKGESWIQIFLNIFELLPRLDFLSDLNQFEGIKYGTTPNNLTKMRLRNDDYKGPPIFYMLFLPEYRLGKFYTNAGFLKEVKKLKELIKSDMENIDSFVKRWHEKHKANVTDWKGNVITQNN